MGRKPSVHLFPDGDIEARVRIPRPLWLAAQELAEQLGISTADVLESGLATLGACVAERRPPRWLHEALGSRWLDAIRDARRRHVTIRSGGPVIDVDALHRTHKKTGTGFYGVAKTKEGYEAWGAKSTLFNDQHRIGIFDTPEEAAHARAQYYRERNLPYGQWELDAIVWRAGNEKYKGSDADMLREMCAHNEASGLGHLNRLPGLPANPSTIAPVIDEHVLTGGTPTSIAALAAANDERERKLVEQARQRQIEATNEPEIAELPEELEDEIECQACGAILDREHAVDHVCNG